MTAPKYFPLYTSCCKQTYGALLMSRTLALWHRLPAVNSSCMRMCVDVWCIWSGRVNSVYVCFQGLCSSLVHIHIGCYRPVVMDFRLCRGDFWCLFVCQREIWQKLLSLSWRLEAETCRSVSRCWEVLLYICGSAGNYGKSDKLPQVIGV